MRRHTAGSLCYYAGKRSGEHERDCRRSDAPRGSGLGLATKCLQALDEEKRAAVLLAYYRGWSREALARRFGRPVPTIKTWLHRSLAQLRDCLAS
jgi:DNA-directed RNA polymerase specialized sigma24 family protein